MQIWTGDDMYQYSPQVIGKGMIGIGGGDGGEGGDDGAGGGGANGGRGGVDGGKGGVLGAQARSAQVMSGPSASDEGHSLGPMVPVME